jgi:hypothetical protein
MDRMHRMFLTMKSVKGMKTNSQGFTGLTGYLEPRRLEGPRRLIHRDGQDEQDVN